MSTQDTDQYREFIQKLKREEQRPAALNEIKNFLTLKPAGEAVSAIRDEGISKIVHCLNVPDKSHVDLTCEVLKLCFQKFQVGEVVKTYTSNMMYLLRHEKDCVRSLAIDEVYKTVTFDAGILPVPQYIDVFVAVAQLVSDRDIGVANKAILITSNLPFEAYPKVLDEMKIALEYNSSSKCNAFEVIVNISVKSYELFQLAADNGYIDYMVSELQSDDFLYQLNILELMSRLVIKPHGINYFVKEDLLQKTSDIMSVLSRKSQGNLLIPGYMKFFGTIAHVYPKQVFEKYPALLDMMFNALESNDLTLLPVALDTLGFIGTTIEGKLSLIAIGARFTQAVQKVGDLLKNSPTEVKIRALHCFACLMSIENDPNFPTSGIVDHRVTLMTREWFRSLSTSIYRSIEILYEICKNPFPDIRAAAFTLLDALCQHQWGAELVARVAGFIEYLLDRTPDHTKQTKEAKYDIIRRLATSGAFDENIIARLKTYIEQGPFYAENLLEVAIEERD